MGFVMSREQEYVSENVSQFRTEILLNLIRGQAFVAPLTTLHQVLLDAKVHAR